MAPSMEKPSTCSLVIYVSAILSGMVARGRADLFCGNTDLFPQTGTNFIPGDCQFSFNNNHLGVTTQFISGGLYNVSVTCDVIGLGLVRAANIRLFSTSDLVTTIHPGISGVCCNSSDHVTNSVLVWPLEFKWVAPTTDVQDLCVNFSVQYVDSGGNHFQAEREICKSPDCAKYYHEDVGHVTSENFPTRYADNLNCTYYVVPDSGRQLYLQSLDLENPYDNKCYDHVTVAGGSLPGAQLCGTLPNAKPEVLFYSAVDGYLEINFVSDMKISGSGFDAFFYTLEPYECNTTTSDMNGTISSLNYPEKYYPSMDCTTQIRVPDGYTVRLTLHHMDIAGGGGVSGDCRADYVEALTQAADGGADSARPWRRCGSHQDYPDNGLTFDSSGPWVDVRFHTDNFSEGRGFVASYQAIESCNNGTESATHGRLVSQNYPENYPNSQDCSSVIQFNTTTYRVELKFHMLNTESEGNAAQIDDQCKRDYVEIDNGERVHRRCGNWQGREGELHFRSLGSTLVLRFVSNERITAPGFEVTWNAVLSDTSGVICPEGWEDTDNFCFQLNHGQHTWLEGKVACQGQGAELVAIRDEQTHMFIQAEIKSRMNASFPKTYWIGANDRQFENDFYWVDGTRVETYYWFPGWPEHNYGVKQPSDDGLANEDCVELRRSFRLPVKGEKLTEEFYWNDRNCEARNGFICQMYKNQVDRPAIPQPPVCNVSVRLTPQSPSGVITSPGYPANYSDFLHCIYNIDAPTGFRVEVEFDTFDLEFSDRCAFDYVTISPFPTSSVGRVEQRRCGDFTSRTKLLRHLSASHQLALTFHSDHNVVAGGFSANLRLVDASSTCGNGSWIVFGMQCYAVFLSSLMDHSKASAVCQDIDSVLSGPTTPAEQIFLATLLSSETKGAVEIWAPGIEGEVCSTFSSSDQSDTQLVQSSKACSSKLGFICSRLPQDTSQKRDETTTTDLRGEWRLTQISGQLYENNIERVLHVVLPEGFRISINITSMDIEYQESCLYDSLTIQEPGRSNDSKILCGQKSSDIHYVTSSNRVTLKFQSDFSAAGRGFVLSWIGYNMSECNWESQSLEGVITSFNNPISYFTNMDCTMSIKTMPNFRVYLEIRQLDLSDSEVTESCSDYLDIDIGYDVTRLCSTENQQYGIMSYLSTSNVMVLKFHSDMEGGGKGFEARYRSVPAATPRISTVLDVSNDKVGLIRSVNYEAGGVSAVEETIVLQAGLGWVVHLELLNVSSIESPLPQCQHTYMEIVDKAVEDAQVIAKVPLCAQTPRATDTVLSSAQSVLVQSHLHEVSLRLKTGSIPSSANPGYVIRYNVLQDPEFFNKTKNVTNVSFPACLDGPYSCYNKGTCSVSPSGGFQCKCPGYYTGLLCHVTWCDVNRCVRGNCNLTSSYYTCLCDRGYFGTYCELDSDTCRTKQCGGHGDCWRENESSVVCECDISYSGPQCGTMTFPTFKPRSAGQRLLEEPIWIGLIVILSLVLIFVVMFCVKRKCSRRLERCCCQDNTKKKQEQEQNGCLDHGIPSPSLPSYNSYLSREASPLDYRRQPQIHIEEAPDEALTPSGEDRNKDGHVEFVYEGQMPLTQLGYKRQRSPDPFPDTAIGSSILGASSVAGSFVLNADQINTDTNTENPLAVLKLTPNESPEPVSRLNRSYRSTPMLHRNLAEVMPRPKSLECVGPRHVYPHIIISNDGDMESTTDEGLAVSAEQLADEIPEKNANVRLNTEMYSLNIPQASPKFQSAPDYYAEYDAKKRRRDFALKSHSANAMYNLDKDGRNQTGHFCDCSSSTESDLRAASGLRRSAWNAGSWEVATYSDSGLGNQSSYESCHSSSRKQRTCQCRKCIKYDRRHHHKSSGHSRHSRHRMTGSHSDVTSYLHSLETTSGSERDRHGGRSRLPGEHRQSSRRALRRHDTVEKCDSSNSEKDYKRPPRPSLRRAKSQDIDLPARHSSKSSQKEKVLQSSRAGSASDLVLVVPQCTEVKDFNSLKTLSNCESNDSLLSKVPQIEKHECNDIAVISKCYDILNRDVLQSPVVNVVTLSSSDEEFSGDCNPDQTNFLSVTQTDSAISSAPKSTQVSPTKLSDICPTVESTPKPSVKGQLFKASSNRKFFVKDSAYQTKENSTDKSNSKTTSSAPSPDFSSGLDRYEKTFSSWPSVRSDERRVTSQLQLAALKLALLQRRSVESKSLWTGVRHADHGDKGLQDDELNGCLPLKLCTLDASRRRSRKLRRLHSLNRESSLQEVTEENSPVVPEDAYQSAPETFIQGSRQNSQFDFSVNAAECIEMTDLS